MNCLFRLPVCDMLNTAHRGFPELDPLQIEGNVYAVDPLFTSEGSSGLLGKLSTKLYHHKFNKLTCTSKREMPHSSTTASIMDHFWNALGLVLIW